MFKIVCVLVATAILGMFFPTTRRIGLLSVALLSFLYPIPVLAVVLILGGGLYLFKSKIT